eukprot:14122495-Ditylum_brightwellii.AAC.1
MGCINQAYCGPVSAVALLNSLQFDSAFGPVGAGVSADGVLLSSFSNPNIAVALSVDAAHIDKTCTTLSKMRFDLCTALKEPHSCIIIGYTHKALGQVGGGHISPIGSYRPPTDSFLIMDVLKYKYPPIWVPAQ